RRCHADARPSILYDRSHPLFSAPPPTVLYTLSLHDALPIWCTAPSARRAFRASLRVPSATPRPSISSSSSPTAIPAAALGLPGIDRKSTRLNSSHVAISYAVFCLKKKKNSSKPAAVSPRCRG